VGVDAREPEVVERQRAQSLGGVGGRDAAVGHRREQLVDLVPGGHRAPSLRGLSTEW
jgi:hypothetical protein